MATDLHLAILHHVFVFALFGLLMAELVLVRPGLGAETVKRIGGLDRGYGLVAVLVFVIGTARVFWGAKGGEYYAGNPWFWAKIGLFVVIGILSIPPTLKFIAWGKAAAADPARIVPDADVASVRRLIHVQLGLLILIPVFAAAMARY